MQRQSATYLGDLVNKAREMPDLFTGEQIEALRDYAKGLIDVGEALDRLNGKAETTNTALGKLAETPKAATVGYNQLQKAVEDCEACLMSNLEHGKRPGKPLQSILHRPRGASLPRLEKYRSRCCQ